MTRIAVGLLLIFFMTCFIAASPLAAADQLNVILIMADDIGVECIRAHGGTQYKTPHLDKLAATGMRFDRCYAQPLCTPTRVQLMTGLYNVRNYVDFGHIDPQAVTFAHHFKQAGYVTGIAGKWQLGQDKDLPRKLGFDESCLWQHTRGGPRYANPALQYDGVEKNFTHGEYGPDLVNDFARDFVKRHKDKPFLLYYPMILTHEPYQPTPDSADWDPSAKGKDSKENVKYFADMVTYCDKLIGKLVNELDRQGLRDKTLILFLGDNGTGRHVGTQLGDTTIQGGKGSANERGMHVPMIVNGPKLVKAGGVCDDLIDTTDFLPTICEAAGIKLPASFKTDGHSFLPQLRGEKGKPRDSIYCWFSRHGGPVPQAEFAMNRKFKLYTDGRLFQIVKDMDEQKPLEGELTPSAKSARDSLAKVLEQYRHARPASLMKPVADAGKEKGKKRHEDD